MTKTMWPERLAKTISKLSPKSNVAQFRDEYAEIVRAVPDDKKSNAREVLLELRPAIESWVTEEDKCPCCALREWTKFYEAAGSMPVTRSPKSSNRWQAPPGALPISAISSPG